MKSRIQWASCLLSLLAGFATGYLRPASGEGEGRAADPRSSSAAPVHISAGSAQSDFDAVVSRAASHASRLHREHEMVGLAERLSPADFPLAVYAVLRL